MNCGINRFSHQFRWKSLECINSSGVCPDNLTKVVERSLRTYRNIRNRVRDACVNISSHNKQTQVEYSTIGGSNPSYHRQVYQCNQSEAV